MNLSKRSGDKELFSGEHRSKVNTMNLSKRSGDKELFSEVQTKENTMNLILIINPTLQNNYLNNQ
jgi:hypothetical protein